MGAGKLPRYYVKQAFLYMVDGLGKSFDALKKFLKSCTCIKISITLSLQLIISSSLFFASQTLGKHNYLSPAVIPEPNGLNQKGSNLSQKKNYD